MPQASIHAKPASNLAPPQHSNPGPNKSGTASSSSSLGRKIRGLLCIPHSSVREGPSRVENKFGLNTVYQPDESTGVVADFVFVHGLGGGSSTTWCIKTNPQSFWPKEWLPSDPDFDGVRIHTFGYNANWKSYLKSPLDIHAFGQSLVEELLGHPKIKDSDNPIVLIGHSMGGLVIKKAFILSKTTPEFAHLAKRFHSIYFLGTPHRGSDLAKVLNNLLRLSGWGRRAYVAGLESKSETIRVLNDTFRVTYPGTHLHSFYETLPIPALGLIVDMESATLGYADERVQLLNANHQNLIKFESTDDSNYRSLRNRLASTIQQIRTPRTWVPLSSTDLPTTVLPVCDRPPGSELQLAPLCHDTDKFEQMQTLRTYLAIDISPDAVLSSLNDTRLDGSCSWFPTKLSFQNWLCPSTPRYFWLKGAPGSGKSTVASHVVEYLKGVGHPTCYYFFNAGEKTTSNLGSFLCSMAYQMADADCNIRDALVQLAQHGPALDFRNPKSLWRNLFPSCILTQHLTRPHFWVIDAIDEAAERGHADDYFLLLSKIDDSIPLKVFVTSRPDFALDALFTQLPTTAESINLEDSLGDIRLYVNTWSPNLPATDADERKRLVNAIVSMSGGNFLWTVLVMKKLQQVMTVEGIHQVLREVPQKMSELYHHNIKRIDPSESEVVKHIIVWVICAVLPLTVDQIKDAVKLSLNRTLARDLRSILHNTCGQFLSVDRQSRVQVVHETARAFLTDPNLESEFRVDRPEGHGLVAGACLEYLLGEEFQHSRRRRSRVTTATGRTAMDDYACLHWSEHLLRSSASSDHLFELLARFFRTNVLSWIERVVRLKDLDCLNRTSRHLSSFLGRRTKYVPLLSTEIDAWIVDLPRIATQFGANLLKDPTSIHTLIPPFCPRDSAIYKQFGSAVDGITLVGAWNSSWGDRICSISYHESLADGVSARDHLFAVRVSDGFVRVYQTSTCEERLALKHEEFPCVVDFGYTAKFIASGGLRSVRLWDTATGHQLFHVNTNTQTLALGFNETESHLIVASLDKYLTVFQIPHGTQLYKLPWLDTFLDTRDPGPAPCPADVKICTELQVMAVIYRSRPVQLWSLETQQPIGACIRPSDNRHEMASHKVDFSAFNPAAARPSLLVSYWDGVIEVYDVMTCKTLASTPTHLVKIAIAPNGKTFAGSDTSGDISIFDFETLQLLHRISVEGDKPATSLVFTSDSLRIIDTRGTQANIWEPLVLASQDSDAQCSERSESVHQVVEDVGACTIETLTVITSLHCCDENGMALCGRDDGWVDICDLDNPEKTMRHLYQHRGAINTVTCIDWAPMAGIAVSADCLGTFRVMKITAEPQGDWQAEQVAESSLEGRRRITQILVHSDGSHVLISSPESDTVWSVATKQVVATITNRRRTAWKWFVRASAPSQLILFEDAALRFFNWTDLAELATTEAPDLPTSTERGPMIDADADAISISSDGNDVVFVQKMNQSTPLHQSISQHPSPGSKIQVFDLSLLSALDLDLVGQPSQPLSRVPSRPPPYLHLPPRLNNPFLASPSDSSLHIAEFASSSSAFARRRSFLTSVAEIPGLDSVIGTVKKFKSWFLVYISREGWVCSLELGAGGTKPLDTFHKHFFIPSVWRAATSSLITKVCRSQDIVFVYQAGVIVVKNGLDNGERVSFSQP